MYWKKLTKNEKDYFRSLVADYWKETMNLLDPSDPPEITKDGVEKYWEDASAYYNTDDDLKFKD